MSTVSVIAKITCREGARDQLVAAFGEYFPQVEGEEGTLVYAVSTDNGDPDVVWVYELYTGDEALQAHSGSEAFKAFGGKLAGLLAGAPELYFTRPAHAKGHTL